MMADTTNPAMSAVVTSDGGIGGLMRTFTPLDPDIEDNTLSSLLELSRTCEALQQKNRSSPQTTTLMALETTRNSPKPSQNGAYMNNMERNSEPRTIKQICKTALSSSLPITSSTNQVIQPGSNPDMSIPAGHTNQKPDNIVPYVEGGAIVSHTNNRPMYDDDDEEDECDDDDMYYDDSEIEEESTKPAIIVTSSDNVAMQKSSHSRRKPKSPQHYPSFNSLLEYKQSEDGSTRASDMCQQDMWSNNIDDDDEEMISEGESFDGKIVYNPDGSAFIIEGESDVSDTDSLLNVPQIEGCIVDHRGRPSTSQVPSFPQIANAFYIHKNPSAFYNSYSMYPLEKRSKVEAPIMHSFKVYDLRSQKENLKDATKGDNGKGNQCAATKALLNSTLFSEEVTTVPTKPILMCFICKLSFGYTKSFMAHAVGEHSMSLSEQEHEIMSRKNSSAIIQGLGRSKEPLMSFLEPTSSSKSAISRETQSSSSFLPPLFKSSGNSPVNSSTSSTNVSYVYSNAKVSPVEHVSKEIRSPSCDASSAKSEQMNSISPHRPPSVSGLYQRLGPDSCPIGASPITSQPERGATSPQFTARGPPALLPISVSPQKENSSSHVNACSPRSACDSSSHCSTPRRLPNVDDSELLYRPYDITESPKSQEPDTARSTESRMFLSPHKLSSVSESNQASSPESKCAIVSSRELSNGKPLHAMPQSSMVPAASLASACPQVDAHGIVIRSGCEDHPQGNISGVECPKCDQILGSSRSLGGHMTMMHSRNSCKTLKCPKCNWHYKYQETLEIHMKEKHPENDTQCIYCLTSQPHPRLARGEVYTCGYKPYRCEVCNYSTTTKGNLSIHMQSDKHINNMQEIQTGTVAVSNPEIKMPPAQPPPPPPPPPPLTPDNAMKKNKPKPTWRCDVCNYETNVARNLRIHMTSEKHTHNMLVLQQNVKHMQRDMQFQMSQLALMGQDPLAIMAGLPPGLAPGLPPFPFDQMFMGPMPGGPGMPGMTEAPMDLTKQENGMLPNMSKASQSNFPMDLKNNNNETSRIFQCSVCNIFSTDSLESLHQHMQLDRSKVILENDDSTTMVGGTYMCNLCQYKTNLKANFQLHCKTDKHLQRLQLVNHIREGGPANEWRLKYMSAGNPVQVRCNACDYYTNSVHKLQLHRTNPRHETNAQLFHHLLTRETCLPPDVMRYFTCTLCSYNTRTKINLIQHIHNMSHMRNESLRVMQLKEQGKEHEYVIENIFEVKECTDTDLVKFDESDGDAQDGQSAHDGEFPDYPGEPVYKPNEHGKGGAGPKINCPFCTFVTTNEMQIQLHVQTQHMGPHAPSLSHGDATEQQMTLRCPLCQEKCRDQSVLEKHLFQVHSVSAEGMHRLLSMVFVGDQPHNQSPNKNHSTAPQKTKENSTVTSQQTSDAETRSDDTESASQNSQPSPDKNTSMVAQSDEITDPMELQAEMLESQALKLAEEASMEGVVLSDKDTDDHYRCQTCTKTFPNIDALYAHQNELGHLELKQTPRGPGYLCWKKGCNQYFKTADALQMHFREIHARTPIVSISERHAYKFRCTQCSLAFKTLDKLQLHSYYHIIRAATKCVVCGRSFRSVAAMRKHVETTHIETMTTGELEKYRISLASIAPLGLLGMPMGDPLIFGAMTSGQMPPLIPLGAPVPLPTYLPESSTKDIALNKTTSSTNVESQSDQGSKPTAEQRSSTPNEQSVNKETPDERAEDSNQEAAEHMDDETSSQPDIDPKDYKDQQFLEDYVNSQAIAENSYSDPTRKFKCHRCKVAFTRQNYLSAHNKTLMHRKGDKANCTMEKYMDPNRPYKCEVCRESFTQKNILLVHYNSVSHLHKVKQHQQQHGGNVDDILPCENGSVTSSNADSPQMENVVSVPSVAANSPAPTKPDENKPYKCNICKVAYSQSATMDIHMRSVLHQTRASKLQELAMTGQVDLSQPLTEQPDVVLQKMRQVMQEQQRKSLHDAAPAPQLRSEQVPVISQSSALMSPPTLLPVVSLNPSIPQAASPSISNPSPKASVKASSGTSTPVISASPTPVTLQAMQVKTEPLSPQKQDHGSNFSCQKCNAVFANQEHLTQHQQVLCYSQQSLMRSMPRFKPQVQRNLLQNIGFECVMQFNEFEQKLSNPRNEEAMEVDPENKANEPVKSPNEAAKEDEEVDNKLDNLPEINKSQCVTCQKEFSSIWVLKAHQEEVHQQLLPIEYVEEFSHHFKDQYEKKQQQSNSTPTSENSGPEISNVMEPRPSTDTSRMPPHYMLDEKMFASMPNLANDIAMAQAMQMMQMPMLMNGMLPVPMNMPMNMMPPLMPMMMPMGHCLDMFPGMPMMDSNIMLAQQQQQAAALAAQQQKRARTRINDEQLKILRAYFDINNSPTEDHIIEMADKSGLPPKVIKHWFRNTLFKERQRNKDSPYNFSIPPSTSLDLEEYEKTGKICVPQPERDLDQERARERERQEQVEECAKALKVKEEEVKAKKCQKELEQKLSQSILNREPIIIKPKIEVDEMRQISQFQFPGQENRDRHSVTSLSDSMRSSAPSTPISTPSAPSLVMPPMLPHPSLAGLTPPGVSFAEFSASLMPLGPTINTSTGQSSVPSTPQHSAPSTPRSMSNVSPSHHGGGPGKRANRTRFTDYQIKVLQEYFEQNAYPKDDDLEHLSRLLNLSPRVIVVWFQNARQKARKNYENQPPLDMSDEASKFTRTPGLNYQCKKCFTVFQRYYELIKHQRTHCYKDDKKLPFSFSQMMGQSSTSYGESSNSESEMLEPEHSPRATSTPKSTATTPTPSTPNNNSKGIEYKCEKCDLVLPRLELWREHQNIHNMNPSLFAPFSNSAFAMLQNVAQQQQQPLPPLPPLPPASTANCLPSPSSTSQQDSIAHAKRKFEEEDMYDSMDQPSRDKRMRTTILPEQLDYLYQKYQIDCNPSRKQLENIASEVCLKKRVVQVWFQNTRARERKGQFRAHQQIIHKRCPFCRALFRAKSALESHLATKHPEEMAKGEINVDAIPDENPDTLPPLSQSPVMMSSGSGLDMAKLLNNPYNMPGPIMSMVSPTSSHGTQDQVQSNMKKLYEDSLKHYLDELSHASHQPKSSTAHSPDCQSNMESSTRSMKTEGEDVPLDLSKPHGGDRPDLSFMGDSAEYIQGRQLFDDSKSESHSELSERGDELFISYLAEDSNPSSPNNSTCSSQQQKRDLMNASNFPEKRYRTQMSSAQIRVMKQLFASYKTPTMAECELVGREIGLPKRVIQVWFQNARAKEKKAKLNYMNTFGSGQAPDLDFQRPPEECKLCKFKYSHKYTVQDHIFTRKHIDNVREAVMRDVESDQSGTSSANNTQEAQEHGKDTKEKISNAQQMWLGPDPASLTPHPHLAQLHAMGLQALSQPGGSSVKEVPASSKVKQEPKEADTKETKKSLPVNAAQMRNPFAGMSELPLPPGADLNSAAAAGLLPFLYPGLGGMYPGMPILPGMMPGPESMMMYDPTTFGTPLTLLQIPQQAIQEVQAKVQDLACTLTRYTQDCRSLTSLKKELSPSDASLAQATYLDVGYICKKCHMVYPGKEACVSHQMTACFEGKSITDMIFKLEQQQYKCAACDERFSLVTEYKSHVKTEAHVKAAHRCLDNRTPSKQESRPSSRASTVTSPVSSAMTPPSSRPSVPTQVSLSSRSNQAKSMSSSSRSSMTSPVPAIPSSPMSVTSYSLPTATTPLSELPQSQPNVLPSSLSPGSAISHTLVSTDSNTIDK